MLKGKVLVVDDDPAIVELLQMVLENDGYYVATAVDGDAVPLAGTLQPDVILLDIMMPGMDGIEVSRQLRANPVTALIPIIVISARERLQATGSLVAANARLSKPFDLQRLSATVAHWVKTPG